MHLRRQASKLTEIDMIHILYERVGGHYMNVGTSEKIVAG